VLIVTFHRDAPARRGAFVTLLVQMKQENTVAKTFV
jgi:hypothetical protein